MDASTIGFWVLLAGLLGGAFIYGIVLCSHDINVIVKRKE